MANYSKNFVNPYPSGWQDLPSESTPITAQSLQAHTDTIEHIEQYLFDNPIEGGGSSISVIDNLNSTSSTDALSANQGRVLKESMMSVDVTSEFTLQPNCVWNTQYTKAIKCGNVIVFNFRFTTPSSTSSTTIVTIPQKYKPKTDVYAPLNRAWSGEKAGIAVARNAYSDISLASTAWTTSVEVVGSITWII